MKKLTTSKRILYGTLIVCAIYIAVIIVIWAIWNREDAAGLAGVIAAPAATVIGFYSWKARAENLHKYGQGDKITMSGSEEYSE